MDKTSMTTAAGDPGPSCIDGARRRAAAGIREDVYQFGRFIEACDLDPNGKCEAATLYAAYCAWIRDQGINVRLRLTATMFEQEVAERQRGVRCDHERTRPITT